MIHETYNITASGRIDAQWISDKTSIPVCMRHNTVLNSTADLLGCLYGGQTSTLPRYIGFIFAASGVEPWTWIPNPGLTMEALIEELENHNADMQLAPFSFAPTLNTSDTTTYKSNITIFHGHTDLNVPGFIDTSRFMTAGSTILGAVLIGSPSNTCSDTMYIPLSRVPLLDNQGNPLERPAGFELALDWSIQFNCTPANAEEE